MLCFHGLPGSRLDLIHQEPLFARHGLEAIAVDRPGFGLSPRRPERTMLDWAGDVQALADRWSLDRFPVIGYSSGGRYALACAWALPERLSLAAVVAGPGPPEMPGFRENLTWLDRATMTLGGTAPSVAAALWRPIRRFALGHPQRFAAAFGHTVSAADRDYLRDPDACSAFLASVSESLRQGVESIVDEYAIEARTWGFALEDISVPVRLWHGDEDEIVGLAHSVYVAGRVPDARIEVVAGAGHFLSGGIDDVLRAVAEEG